ncbi:MAG: M56 family metallopeptidase [Clostridia bacterium]|nr:M56 family metallopeptidase [Clostridia bacterium]
MPTVFAHICNMAVNGSWFILAVLLIRAIFRRAPKYLRCILWGIAGLRLVFPFSVKSVLSLIPVYDPVDVSAAAYKAPSFANGFQNLKPVIGPSVSVALTPSFPYVEMGYSGRGTVTFYASLFWLAGVAALLIYMAVSCIVIRKKIFAAVPDGEVYICDGIASPFIYGIFRPKIYMPSDIDDEKRQFVLSHERAHIRRLDHVSRPLAFVVLAVYWFNPLVWMAYILFCRDTELACDELVIKSMGADKRADYSETLLKLCTAKSRFTVRPVAFGETGIKQRIKAVLNYKKAPLWVITGAAAACVAAALCFLTSPEVASVKTDKALDSAVSQAILSSGGLYRGEALGEGHIILDAEKQGDSVKVYALARLCSFGFENGYLTSVGGYIIPTVFIFKQDGESYTLTKKQEPMDGETYGDSLRKLFPVKHWARVLGFDNDDSARMWEQCRVYGEKYLESIGRNAVIAKNVYHRSTGRDIGEALEKAELDILGRTLLGAGTYEYIENGVRTVYSEDYDAAKNEIILSKYEYESGRVLIYAALDGDTGEIKQTQTVPERIYFNELQTTENTEPVWTTAAY